jgi:uncharacterized membrane protein
MDVPGKVLAIDLVLMAGSLALLALFSLPLVLGTSGSIGQWLMQSIPLLLTLPGIRRHNRRALQWLGFLVLFYLLQGILQLFSPAAAIRWLGAFTTLFCVVLFGAAIVRLRRKPDSR